MLDLVPLARAWRKVTHRDAQPRGVGELLQLHLPQPTATAVGTAPVGRDQQPPRLRIRHAAHLQPPPPERLHGEYGGVVILPDAHPAAVTGHVVDAVRNRLAERLVDEIVYLDPLRLPLRTPLPAPVAILSNQLLFLGVNRNYWLPQGLEGAPPPVDMLELRIAVRMLGAFQRLAVGLQAVAQLVQQPVDRTLAHRMAGAPQVLSQPRRAAAGPQQRPHRVAAGDRVDQPLQRLHQVRIVGGQRLAARAGSSQATRWPSRAPEGAARSLAASSFSWRYQVRRAATSSIRPRRRLSAMPGPVAPGATAAQGRSGSRS